MTICHFTHSLGSELAALVFRRLTLCLPVPSSAHPSLDPSHCAVEVSCCWSFCFGSSLLPQYSPRCYFVLVSVAVFGKSQSSSKCVK